MNWLLPEYIADALPSEAAKIEQLRRRVLDLFKSNGYEFVMPPLLEYLDSLLTGAGSDLKLRTFKLVDQLSGRTLGVRADMTPQVARIDAHLLNRPGVTRLCYCDSVLHTLPASLASSREPVQVGAEVYGFAGIEADVGVIRLMGDALGDCGVPATRIDVGHVGIFRALVRAAGLSSEQEEQILSLLQAKDLPGLESVCADMAPRFRSSLLALPNLFGSADVLQRAKTVLADLPEIQGALADLERLQAALPDLPLSFDLSDLRGYHYHNGVVFAAYHPAYPAALALGGRYDGVGKAFGRDRPATGFSFDLREVARLATVGGQKAGVAIPDNGVVDVVLAKVIKDLRAQGEVVVELLPGETLGDGPKCDRVLVKQNGEWIIQATNGINLNG